MRAGIFTLCLCIGCAGLTDRSTFGSEPPTWTAAQGDYSLRAELLSIQADEATLRTPNGERYVIAVTALDTAGQRRIREIQAARSPSRRAEMQRALAAVKNALGNRDPQRAQELLQQVQTWSRQANLEQEIASAVQAVNDVDAFCHAYRSGARHLQAGDRLALSQGICRIESTLDQRIALSLNGQNYDFDTAQLTSIPHELVIAVARRATADTAATRRSLLWFRSLDDLQQDAARWQAAARKAQ